MRKRFAFLIVGSLLSVSACKEQPPSNVMFDDGNNDSDIPPPIALNQAYGEPDAPVSNGTNTLPPASPPAFTDQQQISDDADATGMTARLPADETGSAANETQPAE
jgi:hypothetical protein